jgi:hypothetical protein
MLLAVLMLFFGTVLGTWQQCKQQMLSDADQKTDGKRTDYVYLNQQLHFPNLGGYCGQFWCIFNGERYKIVEYFSNLRLNVRRRAMCTQWNVYHMG